MIHDVPAPSWSSTSHRNRHMVLALACVIALLVGLARTIMVAVWPHQYIRQGLVPGHRLVDDASVIRASIVDRNGELLALSVPAFRVIVDPVAFERLSYQNISADDLWNDLKQQIRTDGYLPESSTVLGTQINTRAKQNLRYLRVTPPLSMSVAERLRKALTKYRIAVFFEYTEQRLYPHGASGAATIGLASSEGQGLFGLERVLDPLINTERAKIRVHKDASGRIIDVPTISPSTSRAQDARVALDVDVQLLLEQLVNSAVPRLGENPACAVVLDASTGELLACTSRPISDLSTGRWDGRWTYAVHHNQIVRTALDPGRGLAWLLFGSDIEDATSLWESGARSTTLVLTDDGDRFDALVELLNRWDAADVYNNEKLVRRVRTLRLTDPTRIGVGAAEDHPLVVTEDLGKHVPIEATGWQMRISPLRLACSTAVAVFDMHRTPTLLLTPPPRNTTSNASRRSSEAEAPPQRKLLFEKQQWSRLIIAGTSTWGLPPELRESGASIGCHWVVACSRKTQVVTVVCVPSQHCDRATLLYLIDEVLLRIEIALGESRDVG